MAIATLSILLAISLFSLSFILGIKTKILREGECYSFSRFQLWLWTTVILPAFMLRWGSHFQMNPTLNNTTLSLLGLSGGTSLMFWISTDIKKNKGQLTKINLPTKGFWNDILADTNGEPSMARMQQLLFTFAYISVYISIFFQQPL